MTDATAPAPSQTSDKPAGDQAPEEWKPEPRQWTWKDVFTAPMLAFKPKCMVVMALTAVALSYWFRYQPEVDAFGSKAPVILAPVIDFVWSTIALVVFSLAATLVAVFMKADLLDDEFLSFGEAFAQYKKRLAPAILVPLFLMGILGGFHLLIAGGALLSSIPYAGPTLYALFYPLAFLLSLFVVLLAIAVGLSVFVFPSIIAIRKHGWFDNVVDTFEAVGTKPHVLVGSGLLVALLMAISLAIGMGAMRQLRDTTSLMPGNGLVATEAKSDEVQQTALGPVLGSSLVGLGTGITSTLLPAGSSRPTPAGYPSTYDAYPSSTTTAADANAPSGWYKVTGAVTGGWKILLGALIVGYCLNLFIGGGMLTYLVVREDDYWDDEDLEDLDKLAKELEEEAKQEAAKGGAQATGAAPVTATAPTTASADKPAEPTAPGGATPSA
jgi:hypothetical protein